MNTFTSELKQKGKLLLGNQVWPYSVLHVLNKLTLNDFEHEQEAVFAKNLKKLKKSMPDPDKFSTQVRKYMTPEGEVADPKECSRMTLPKSVPTDEEATI